MAVALAVVSLYFLHVGFRNGSPFCLSLGGIAAGLCLASSISGKQYLVGLVIAAPLYGSMLLEALKAKRYMELACLGLYGFLAAATPILLYIAVQSRSLRSVRIRLSARFLACDAVSSISESESGLIPSSFGTAFSRYRVPASLFRMCCLFRYHTIGS